MADNPIPRADRKMRRSHKTRCEVLADDIYFDADRNVCGIAIDDIYSYVITPFERNLLISAEFYQPGLMIVPPSRNITVNDTGGILSKLLVTWPVTKLSIRSDSLHTIAITAAIDALYVRSRDLCSLPLAITSITRLDLASAVRFLNLSCQHHLKSVTLDCPKLVDLRLPNVTLVDVTIKNSRLQMIKGRVVETLNLSHNKCLRSFSIEILVSLYITNSPHMEYIETRARHVSLTLVNCARVLMNSHEVSLLRCNISRIDISGYGVYDDFEDANVEIDEINWNCRLKVNNVLQLRTELIKSISGDCSNVIVRYSRHFDGIQRRKKYCVLRGDFKSVRRYRYDNLPNNCKLQSINASRTDPTMFIKSILGRLIVRPTKYDWGDYYTSEDEDDDYDYDDDVLDDV